MDSTGAIILASSMATGGVSFAAIAAVLVLAGVFTGGLIAAMDPGGKRPGGPINTFGMSKPKRLRLTKDGEPDNERFRRRRMSESSHQSHGSSSNDSFVPGRRGGALYWNGWRVRRSFRHGRRSCFA